MNKCSLKGRDCIEEKSNFGFNCNTTCEGIFANVQWEDHDGRLNQENKEKVEKVEATVDFNAEYDSYEYVYDLQKEIYDRLKDDLKKEMELMKNTIGKKGEELDKKKYERLVSEYRDFKKQNVRHLRFYSAGDLSKFGK